MRVMLKLFFFTSITLFAVTAKSQELLNYSESQIKNAMVKSGGILKVEKVQIDAVLGGKFNELVYLFPKPKVESNDILIMSFYLTTKNRCIHYSTIYQSDRFQKDLVVRFNRASSGLTKADTKSDYSLKWINKKNKYEVYILKTRFSSSGASTAFTLDISNYR
jgi:hypothetical protein